MQKEENYTQEEKSKLEQQRKKRSEKYGIEIREDGHLTPPSKYFNMGAKTEDDYADPVNWRYPIHDKEHALAALRYFAKEKNRNEYKKEKSRLVILQRIIEACLKFGVEVRYNPEDELMRRLPEKLKKKLAGYEENSLSFSVAVNGLKFEGIAITNEPAYLNTGEMIVYSIPALKSIAASLKGKPIRLEHDQDTLIGVVEDAVFTEDVGTGLPGVIVKGEINDEQIANKIRSGELRGLSVRTWHYFSKRDNVKVVHDAFADEISLVKNPRFVFASITKLLNRRDSEMDNLRKEKEKLENEVSELRKQIEEYQRREKEMIISQLKEREINSDTLFRILEKLDNESLRILLENSSPKHEKGALPNSDDVEEDPIKLAEKYFPHIKG